MINLQKNDGTFHWHSTIDFYGFFSFFAPDTTRLQTAGKSGRPWFSHVTALPCASPRARKTKGWRSSVAISSLDPLRRWLSHRPTRTRLRRLLDHPLQVEKCLNLKWNEMFYREKTQTRDIPDISFLLSEESERMHLKVFGVRMEHTRKARQHRWNDSGGQWFILDRPIRMTDRIFWHKFEMESLLDCNSVCRLVGSFW